MDQFLVTVKIPRNPAHDPFNKIAGTCPVSGAHCTDITGQHHTLLVSAQNIDQLQRTIVFPDGASLTRIEKV